MRPLSAVSALVLLGCGVSAPTPAVTPSLPSADFGLLVMAHGGSEEWNRAVEEAVSPLAADRATVVAFGMADPVTLAAGLDSLEAMGVRRVAVVRLFVSGESFLDQTRYLLGLDPPFEDVSSFVHHGNHGSGTPHHEPPLPIAHSLQVATHRDGLMDSEEAREILAGRALAHSSSAPYESVLVLAHGMGEDDENDRLLFAMGPIARAIAEAPFHEVRPAALREDWPEARASAREEIRAFVSREVAAGRRVIVVPLRLSGFGPYAEVLTGLDYVPTEGLLPHEGISRWIRRAAEGIACERGWVAPSSCPSETQGEAVPR